MTRDVGDGYAIRYEARSPTTGVLTDTTMALVVTDPAGATSNPTITHTSTGIYDASFTLATAGLWRWKWTASVTIIDVAYGDVLAQDPAPALYASLADLKLAAGEIADSARDGLLLKALAAASRGVDDYCGAPSRRFYRDTAVSARQFRTAGRVACDPTGFDGDLLLIDDIADTTGLIVEVGDGTTWTAVTDYEVDPDQSPTNGWPVTGLRRPRSTWPTRKVRVTARWGWPTVPDKVSQATLLQATRLYRRKDSPEGVTGNAEWGTMRVSRVDPDVADLLTRFRLPGIG